MNHRDARLFCACVMSMVAPPPPFFVRHLQPHRSFFFSEGRCTVNHPPGDLNSQRGPHGLGKPPLLDCWRFVPYGEGGRRGEREAGLEFGNQVLAWTKLGNRQYPQPLNWNFYHVLYLSMNIERSNSPKWV